MAEFFYGHFISFMILMCIILIFGMTAFVLAFAYILNKVLDKLQEVRNDR